MKPEQIAEVVAAHGRWLRSENDGLRANLTRADLTRAILDGANLDGANLARANLTDANLTDANLADANLDGANLDGANLDGANLTRANLDGAILARADLTRAAMPNGFEVLVADDGRGYTLFVTNGMYSAGCRWFTAAQAMQHWSNPDHKAPESAKLLHDAVAAHVARTVAS
jgi:hypothetical protein